MTERVEGWGVEEVGGAAAVAGAEFGDGGQALVSEGVGDAAFEAFVGESPDDFGELALLNQVVDVPVEFLFVVEVAAHAGAEAVEGGADIGIGTGGEVDCA